MNEHEDPGTGEPMEGIPVPPDGTMAELHAAQSDETEADNGERYVDSSGLHELDEMPVQRVEVLPEMGLPVTVVIIAHGEDEETALDAVMLAHGTWLDYMNRADELTLDDSSDLARQLRMADDGALLVEPHYTMRAQIRRVRHDVPTMNEHAKAQHQARGGAGATDADRDARVADVIAQQAAPNN